MPPFGGSWQRRLNRKIFLPLIRNTARRLGLRDVLIITYLPSDTAVDLIELLRSPRSLIIYYCVADFAQLTPQVDLLRESEKSLLQLSDLVFAQGPEIADHAAQWSDEIHIFPPGVDLDKFPLPEKNGNSASRVEDSLFENSDQAALLRSLPRPIIGYIGGLHRHIDFGLVIEMARARRDWSWIMVGPIQTSVGTLGELPNVYLLGQKPHNHLVHYIRQFDVCIVPYVNSIYTATVVPTKINEYLAVGKPVVSTRLPAVCEFNLKHQILQTAATDPDVFLQCIERALVAPSDEIVIAQRREVAKLGSWETRLEAMSKLIRGALAAKRAEADVKT
ncbi:MAG: glycosyltransferase [Acidobacteriota bacterium]|nr:glycosyltransferase [Acidobacteriota bacterium]